MKRLAFLSAAGAAALGAVALPQRAFAQFVVSDPISEQALAQQILQKTVSNKIALANDLNALRIAMTVIFDHESFIRAAWPDIAQQIDNMTARWNDVSLLNYAGKDLLDVLASRYPGKIDITGVQRDIMSRLQKDGIDEIASWLRVLQADHQVTTKEVQRADYNAKVQVLAKSAKDQMTALIQVASAGVNIAGAQANTMETMGAELGEVIDNQNRADAAKQNSDNSSTAMVFGTLGGGKYHPDKRFSDSQLRQDAEHALNVPILQPTSRASFQKRIR